MEVIFLLKYQLPKLIQEEITTWHLHINVKNMYIRKSTIFLKKIIINIAFICKKMLYPKDDIISKLINKFNVIPVGFLRMLNNVDKLKRKIISYKAN